MALRQLIISRKLDALKGELAAAETEQEALRDRRSAMEQREAELTEALNEVTEETTAEDKATVEAEADKWEADDKALKTEEDANEQRKADLQRQIDELNTELEELNARAAAPVKTPEKTRKDEKHMDNRKFFSMNAEERDAMFAREDVKGFMSFVRDAYKNKRAVTNAELTIPEVMLPLLREVAAEASKLMKHVNLKSVGGSSRQNILGTIPQAVWTEATGKINKIDFAVNQIEVDGFKVGGYMAIPNSTIEDSEDPALAAEVITMIGKAIGLALDMAILYGTGTKMPVGVVTDLSQATEPSYWGAYNRAWVDLHATHIVKTSATKLGLFEALVGYAGLCHNNYSTGAMTWVMNQRTYTKLLVAAMSVNAAGAIVSGQGMTMPVVGGAVEILDFVPDDNIIAGYMDEYLLVERAGTQIAASGEYLFAEDQTAFKGTARYDGKPVIPEGFVAIGINNVTPAASITFASDTANSGSIPAGGN